MSREQILATLRGNQPAVVQLPVIPEFKPDPKLDLVEKFKLMAEGIGSTVYVIERLTDVIPLILARFSGQGRIVTTVEELVTREIPAFELNTDPHTYADVDVAIFKPLLAVAENSALWLTEDLLGIRVLPFITQHIVMVVDMATLVPDMHRAYQQIGSAEYGFGTFIAGPSKTADIEQSLVLGAHGPRSMTIYLYSSK
ncbi:LutC/YkgG family protein [Pedobacter sp. AW31-3R]|uniref:LutC/YkgG family protein n=1 Tax=Pedobacter sp. AW31-3R TaxID=3445781 RepID=UPI003FA132B9